MTRFTDEQLAAVRAALVPDARPSVINAYHYGFDLSSARVQIMVGVSANHDPERRRRGPPLPGPALWVGRPTPLGNPYTKERHGEDALELYRAHLWKKLRGNDGLVLEWMRHITPAHCLMCVCAPKPCHANIIVSAWGWMREHHLVRPEHLVVAAWNALRTGEPCPPPAELLEAIA